MVKTLAELTNTDEPAIDLIREWVLSAENQCEILLPSSEQEDVARLGGEQCIRFFPFLWTSEGSVEKSHRGVVPVSEAFDLKVDLLKQLQQD